jgi:hypothetical protein
MSISERASERKESTRLPVLSEIKLLGLVAFGFLILHVLAGMLLLPSGSGLVTPQEQASVSSTD